MNLEKFVKKELGNFKVEFNKESFLKEIYEIKKVKSKTLNLNSKILIDREIAGIEGELLRIEYIQELLSLQKEYIENSILFLDILSEKDLKYIYMFKPRAVITKEVQLINPVKLFPVPVFVVDDLNDSLKELDIKLKLKKIKIKGTNLFFDVGYGADIFFIIFPYDSKIQSIEDLSFKGSFFVLKEIIRRILNVTKPKGFKIRVLLCDLRFHLNYGLKFHLKKMDKSRIISVLNIQDTGLGNEKLVVKNIRYIIDGLMEANILTGLNRLGMQIERTVLKEFSNIDELINNKSIIWLLSYPNKYKHKLNHFFLSKEFYDDAATMLFLILKNALKSKER